MIRDMRRALARSRAAAVTAIAVTAVCGVLAAAQARAATSLGFGAWCWFASPQAIRADGQTITGFVDRAGDIVAVSLLDGIAVHRFVLHAHFQVDDHDTPTFWQRPDGRIMAFYSKHASGLIRYRLTVAPGDITRWGAEHQISDASEPGGFGDTYPNPVYVAAERRLYLYFRGATWHPTMTYSDDEGAHWAKAVELIDPRTIAGPGDGGPRPDRPYAKYAQSGLHTFIAFTNAHPQSRPTNIYLLERTGSRWTTITGRPTAVPAAPSAASRVYDAVAHRQRAWIWDVAVDGAGFPVITFATFAEGNWQQDDYWWARWTGHSWFLRRLVVNAGGTIDSSGGQPAYAAGITLDAADPAIVFLSRKVQGHFRVEIWRTTDAGSTWRSSVVPDSTNGVRPIGVLGDTRSAPEVLFLAGHYGDYTAFDTRVTDVWSAL